MHHWSQFCFLIPLIAMWKIRYSLIRILFHQRIKNSVSRCPRHWHQACNHFTSFLSLLAYMFDIATTNVNLKNEYSITFMLCAIKFNDVANSKKLDRRFTSRWHQNPRWRSLSENISIIHACPVCEWIVWNIGPLI